MGYTVSGINDRTSERAVLDLKRKAVSILLCSLNVQSMQAYLRAQPSGGKGQDGLNGDVNTSSVKGLKEDLGCVFSVLGRIEGRFSLFEG